MFFVMNLMFIREGLQFTSTKKGLDLSTVDISLQGDGGKVFEK